MSLADAFKGMDKAKEEKTTPAKRTKQAASKAVFVSHPMRKPSPGKGKSSDPEYAALKVFVRIDTRRQAERKWQDTHGGDMSELVETLLVEYLKS